MAGDRAGNPLGGVWKTLGQRSFQAGAGVPQVGEAAGPAGADELVQLVALLARQVGALGHAEGHQRKVPVEA